jgi:hypothetical protein
MFVACMNPREFNAVGDIVWYPQELTLLSPIKHTFCSLYLFQMCRANNQWRTNHVSTNTLFRFVNILFAMYSYNLGKVRADIFGSESYSDNGCRIGICKFKGSLSREILADMQIYILIHHQVAWRILYEYSCLTTGLPLTAYSCSVTRAPHSLWLHTDIQYRNFDLFR